MHLYIDDTQLYLPFSLTTDAAIQKALIQTEDCKEDIRKWLTFSKVKLIEEKTDILLIVPSHQPHKCNMGILTIGGCEITASANSRNLGVYFNCQMLFKQQENAVVKSYNYQI